ncbi:MAG: sensor histidine kinase [Leifsonia xyli]|nr:MAG: sensor histidine kinase [Leifsonia xyli]
MKLSHLSIRARITGGSLLIALLISLVAGIIVDTQVQRIVVEGQVRVLESVEGQYLTAIENGDTVVFDPPGPGQFVAVVDPDGALKVNTLPAGLAALAPELAARDGVRTVAADGTDYLVKAAAVDSPGGTWQLVTASLTDDQVLNQVAWLLIASLAAINLAFGAASWFIGSAALGPVSNLRRSAAELATRPGEELLPVGPARDEIADLAETLNRLILELRASAARERQIVSDASHEFRTPLAIMQTRLELAQREATTLDAMRADVTEAQRTLARLSALATSLLELSRLDAQRVPGNATIAQLATELGDAADRGRLRVGARDIRIDYLDDTDAKDAVVAVAEVDFGRVCDNLVTNALAALDGAGTVLLRLDADASHARLSVIDDGPGMDPAYLPSALDRFSRQGGSRTWRGAGLGLAIVAGIAEVSGGEVVLDNRPGHGLRVEVSFPLVG